MAITDDISKEIKKIRNKKYYWTEEEKEAERQIKNLEYYKGKFKTIEEAIKKEDINEMLKCFHCGKPLRKVSDYEYKWDCDCVPNNIRLSVG
jgi:hypothetical protein